MFMGEKVSRTRNYATVVYPESAKDNWLDILSEYHVPCLVSPLHDCDHDPDGCIKKPHYHVLVMFDSVKTVSQFDEIREAIGGVGHEYVQSTRGYARYLCHLDNPEKYQYDLKDVRALSGADFDDIISLVTDKYKAIGQMQDFIKDHEMVSYSDFMDYCREYEWSWYKILCDCGTYVIKEYQKALSWKIAQRKKTEV